MQMTIRAGRDEDRDSMRRVFIDAGRTAWNHILSADALAELSLPDRWRPGGGVEVLLAESAGDIVGFICLRPSADDDAGPGIAEVDAFYTHPSVWGRGVGRALLSAAVARLTASGFRQATLWTEHRNHRPLKFYRAAGWKLDGAERRRAFHGTELIELRHRLPLV